MGRTRLHVVCLSALDDAATGGGTGEGKGCESFRRAPQLEHAGAGVGRGGSGFLAARAGAEETSLTVDSRDHWESIYRKTNPTKVSWFQPASALSIQLISEAAPDHSAAILDVGGGASTLVDGLLRLGYGHIAVLDLSRTALAHARQRLGRDA